jgi:hypothetical protein
MKLKTNKTLTKEPRKKIEIKRIKIKLKKKYIINCNWRTKLEINKPFIKGSSIKIRNQKKND